MTENDLSVDRMSDVEFYKFRRKSLDGECLNASTMRIIKKMFDLDPDTIQTVSVCCDEAHAYRYSCLDFRNRNSAVVLRLLDEIERYQERLEDIRKRTDYKS